MKKLLSIITILALIFMGGCQISKITNEQIFEKKQECIKYKDPLQNKIDKNIADFTSTNTVYNYSIDEKIEEIFYSVSANSCIAIISKVKYMGDDITNTEEIIDLLTDKVIATNDSIDSKTGYYEIKNKLKGE